MHAAGNTEYLAVHGAITRLGTHHKGKVTPFISKVYHVRATS